MPVVSPGALLKTTWVGIRHPLEKLDLKKFDS
jgi:hypothetical protein